MFLLPSYMDIRIAEDLLSSSAIILPAEAHLFCSTSEAASIYQLQGTVTHADMKKAHLLLRSCCFLLDLETMKQVRD